MTLIALDSEMRNVWGMLMLLKVKYFIFFLLVSSFFLIGCGVSKSVIYGVADTNPPIVGYAFLNTNGWAMGTTEKQTLKYTGGWFIFEKSYYVPIITTQYKDNDFAQYVAKETMYQLKNTDMVQAFITKIDLNKVPEDLESKHISLYSVMEEAEQELKNRVKKDFRISLTNTNRQNQYIGKKPGELRTYTGYYGYGGMSLNALGRTISVPGGNVQVETVLFGWECPKADNMFVVTAIYPKESISQTATNQLTGAISVDVNINLDLKPYQERKEIEGLIGAVSCS